jgi:hypothetical protein
MMETRAEIYEKIDFESLFRDFNRAKKRKLTKRDKILIRLLVNRYLPVTSGDTEALSKALSAGPGFPPSKLTKGAALRIEPLDVVLKFTAFDDSQIKLHKLLKKGKKNGKQVAKATNRIRRQRKLRVR